MIYASAAALSLSLLPSETAARWLYPNISRIRTVSVAVTMGVIRAAQADGVDRELALRNLADEELQKYIEMRMYDPFLEHEKVDEEIRELAEGLLGRTSTGQANGRSAMKVVERPGTANGTSL